MPEEEGDQRDDAAAMPRGRLSWPSRARPGRHRRGRRGPTQSGQADHAWLTPVSAGPRHHLHAGRSWQRRRPRLSRAHRGLPGRRVALDHARTVDEGRSAFVVGPRRHRGRGHAPWSAEAFVRYDVLGATRALLPVVAVAVAVSVGGVTARDSPVGRRGPAAGRSACGCCPGCA